MRDVPPAITVKSGHGVIFVWLGIAAAAVSAVVLFYFNPADGGFYPRCFFKMMTGLDCPGCGGLRATHQLLHGHLREAFALYPLLVAALPLVGYFLARPLAKFCSGHDWPQPFNSTAWIWVGAAIVIVF